MESYAFQVLSRKQIKKLAARFTDEEIRASLGEDEDNVAFIYDGPEGTVLRYWNATCGPAVIIDEDSVRSYAQLEYMRRHGYPVLRSDAEIEAYAKSLSQ